MNRNSLVMSGLVAVAAVCATERVSAFDPKPIDNFVDHVNNVVTNRTVAEKISSVIEGSMDATTNGFRRAETNLSAKTRSGWTATTNTTGRAWDKTHNWTTNTTHKIHRKMEPFHDATTNLFSSAAAPVRRRNA